MRWANQRSGIALTHRGLDLLNGFNAIFTEIAQNPGEISTQLSPRQLIILLVDQLSIHARTVAVIFALLLNA
jgi:hypothetical protein